METTFCLNADLHNCDGWGEAQTRQMSSNSVSIEDHCEAQNPNKDGDDHLHHDLLFFTSGIYWLIYTIDTFFQIQTSLNQHKKILFFKSLAPGKVDREPPPRPPSRQKFLL